VRLVGDSSGCGCNNCEEEAVGGGCGGALVEWPKLTQLSRSPSPSLMKVSTSTLTAKCST